MNNRMAEGRMNRLNSSDWQENRSKLDRKVADYVRPTELPISSSLLNLGNQAYLIELFPMAAYAVRAPDGVIVWFNSRAAEMWGREPVIGDTDERFCGAHTLYHADGTYMAHCDTPVALALNTGAAVHEEEVVIARPDGSRVMVSVHIDPIRDKNGTIVGVVNFFHDITERKQNEQVLGERARLLDLSNDAILVRDADDRVTYWNKSASELYGFSRDEAIGRMSHELLQTEFPESLEHITDQLHRDNRWSGVLLHTCKDGRQIVVGSRWALDRDQAGNLKCVLETNNDITRQKQDDLALRESQERLRVLAKDLENRVRVRTHQLEQRSTEALQQSAQLRELSNRLQRTQDEERRRIARDLHDSAGQTVTALGLTLATIAQHANQHTVLKKAVKESQELVRGLSDEIRTMSYLLHPPLLDENGLPGAVRWYTAGLAERGGVNVHVEISENFGRLPDELETAVFRIMQECLTNIHRHTDSKTATIRLSRNEESVSLEIRDRGRGIPPGKLEEIRGHRTGVGITGMRERVRHLQGKMDIQSNPNGTKVSVTLPIRIFETERSQHASNGV